ncbi:homeobox domain-containing protein [Aspergillus tanneri]|nr:uncharacterized protein ATNIH1004_000373 [Aspergillus tanneri]KAA8651485.1 hypothetical protein ATNIH1004_000373 [Aspergillus tanneri]
MTATTIPQPLEGLPMQPLDTNPGVDVAHSLFQRPLTDVSQWLDGAYCPPNPCTYCRRHRLQCLIIRTTAANPNPVTSCSSCVALFRECSLAQGEKRKASGFETLSPVLGHLHGLREICEDIPAGCEYRPPTIPDETKPRELESKQFVRKGTRVLRAWFLQNQARPYPTEDEKAQLMHETGFSRQRISTWFANARRRQKQKRIQQQPSLNGSSLPVRTHRAGSPMPIMSWTSMTPLERWQASPPEDDPVPESAIRDAISSAGPDDWDPSSHDELFSFINFAEPEPESQTSTSSHLDSSADGGFGSKRSDASSDSVSSTWSHQSDGGVPLPFPRRPSHLRHRSSSSRLRPPSSTPSYQCTFCPRSFKKKNDWTRHESSIHLPLDVWICTPSLFDLEPYLLEPSKSTSASTSRHEPKHKPESGSRSGPESESCHFCNHPSPTHTSEHDFHVCSETPRSQRSFPRKDHLWQHLRKFHGCTKLPVPDLDAWRSSCRDRVRSRCGFCGTALASWDERADHLARHFREGWRMEEWLGDWGFEDDVQTVLRRAVVPAMRMSGRNGT